MGLWRKIKGTFKDDINEHVKKSESYDASSSDAASHSKKKTRSKDDAKPSPKKEVSKDETVKSKKTADTKKLESPRTSSKTKERTVSGLLIRPLFTEKQTLQKNVYLFEVDTDASKVDIKREVFGQFGVTPKKVSVINYRGKIKRVGRITGKRKNWRKAYVTLKEGDSIE